MQLLFLNLAILFTVATLVSAAPALSDATTHTLHEKRATDPRSWIKRSKVAAGTLLPMRIGLKQRNLHLGYDLLMEMSVPPVTHGLYCNSLDFRLKMSQYKAKDDTLC